MIWTQQPGALLMQESQLTAHLPVRYTSPAMKTYVFKVEVEQEEDGRWSARIPVLPGCATWGYTKEEALESLKEAAKAYLEVLAEQGKVAPLEKKVLIIPEHAITVSV
jgi:predicted RNase H-like HicB family nuclease